MFFYNLILGPFVMMLPIVHIFDFYFGLATVEVGGFF